MSSTSKLSQDRQVTLCALQVLELIADSMERQGAADFEDITTILGFFRDVAHPALVNVEKTLLVPVMSSIHGPERDHVGTALEHHRAADGMFRELERCFQAGECEEFVAACRRYTSLVSNLLFIEQRLLPVLIRPRASDQAISHMLDEFGLLDAELATKARAIGPTMRRLESKYMNPHCI